MKETKIKGRMRNKSSPISAFGSQGFTERAVMRQADIMHDLPDGSLFRFGQKIRLRVEGEGPNLPIKEQ